MWMGVGRWWMGGWMDGWDVARRPTSERREAPPCPTGNILPWERPVGGDLPNAASLEASLPPRPGYTV
jgi:hypothetical protein